MSEATICDERKNHLIHEELESFVVVFCLCHSLSEFIIYFHQTGESREHVLARSRRRYRLPGRVHHPTRRLDEEEQRPRGRVWKNSSDRSMIQCLHEIDENIHTQTNGQ